MRHGWRQRLSGATLGLLALTVADPAGAQTLFQVKDINTTPTSSSNPTHLTSVNGFLFEPPTLYFAADDGLNGVELWKSDGTDGGTVMVENINGAASSDPTELTRVSGAFLSAGRLFFAANDGVNGVELWKSDGTAAGTQLVKNIRTAAASSNPTGLTAVPGGGFSAGKVFFAADDGTSGVELWISDGTSPGTVRVKDINVGGSSSPSSMVAIGSVVFFAADDGLGAELWKSDGTELGTVKVKDINPGGASFPIRLTNVNGVLFFSAFLPATGRELWKSDGTSLGTTMVKEIHPTPGEGAAPAQLVAVGSTLFFQAEDGVNGRELWKSDGTDLGTVMVKDVNPGPGSSVLGANDFAGIAANVNGTLFYAADDGTSGAELWKSDGTELGTMLVRDINPGPSASSVNNLVNVNGIACFGARNAASDQLWRSDGRAAGTFMVRDFGAGDTATSALAVSGPFLFLASYADGGGNELWATDLVFKNGFESGLPDVWSSANADGGDLSVQPAAALEGTAGLAALVDDTTSVFVVDESPNNDTRYRARFRLDPNGFDPGEADGHFRVRVFIAFEEAPTTRLITLVLKRQGGQYGLMTRVRLDDGSRAQTPFFNITDDPHVVELDWKWSQGADANNGSLEMWIDEVSVSTLTALDNSAGLVDFARLGVMSVKSAAGGTLYFDDFESRRDRYIGTTP